MKLLPLLALLVACEAYKILLVFPVPSKSHINLCEGYVRHLLKAGHEITYIAPAHINNPPKNLRQIDVSSNYKLLPKTGFHDLSKMIHKEMNYTIAALLHRMFRIANGTLLHENVQELIHNQKEQFDVVVAEWLFSELYSGLASVFNCPLIWSSPAEPHPLVLSLMDDPPNPVYVLDWAATNIAPTTFTQRAGEFWTYLYVKYNKWLFKSLETRAYERAYTSAMVVRGRPLPPLSVAKYNASLMLGNSHVPAGDAVSLPLSYVSIAGYHVEDIVQPLPKDILEIMDSAKDGVIYFSLGSAVQCRTLPLKLKRGLLDLFGELNRTVIWKLEEELPYNTYKNVHVFNILPQQSILAHPNCILFITHGGLLSIIETIVNGVPIIGIPVSADQFLNVDRAVQKGYAKRVDLDYDTPDNLKIAVNEVLGNPRYRERVKELSFVFHDRPVPPGKELVHWVEHVVRTGGAPHLRSPALMLPWYQKMCLDLAAVILVFLYVLIRLFRKVKSLFSKKITVCPKKTN